MKFPYLHYSVYKTCPLAYKWRFVEKIKVIPDKRNAFIGILLAKVVETFYREKWWREKDIITRMQKATVNFSRQIIESENIRFKDEELNQWMVVATETLPKIVKVIRSEKLIGSTDKNINDENLAEYEVEVKHGEDALQARPDLIIRRNEMITLLDGKGGKTIGKYVDNDQLYFYCIPVKKLYNRLPHRMGFWWFRHEQIVWLPITNDLVVQILVKIDAALAGIKERKFDPTPGPHCRLCDFKDICIEGQTFLSKRHIQAIVDVPDNFGPVGW
jgi:CRISPR/Cas system-associated exonuclease Cas4 (RecB family)